MITDLRLFLRLSQRQPCHWGETLSTLAFITPGPALQMGKPITILPAKSEANP
jgi:hypothetical protein